MEDNNRLWEQKTIRKLLEISIKEQRAKRYWSIFFKLITFIYILFITLIFIKNNPEEIPAGTKFTAVIALNGPIIQDSDSSATKIIPLLRKAYANSMSKGIVLKINSPGGTPVQSNKIYQEIKRLQKIYPNKKLYAVIEDIGVSGAYWVACSADKIYSDKSSIVGSIGASISSFGFVDTMDKIGITRRLYTSGSNKNLLDPFSVQNKEQVDIIKKEVKLMGDMFINLVKESRGMRLKQTVDMFSGRFWLGIEAKEIGIIDGFFDSDTIAKDIIGAPQLVEYSHKQNSLNYLVSQTKKLISYALSLTFRSDINKINIL